MAKLRTIVLVLRALATLAFTIAFVMPQVQYPGFESPDYAFASPIYWLWFLWPALFLAVEWLARKKWLSVTLAVVALPVAWASHQAIALQMIMDGVGLVGRDLAMGSIVAIAILYALQILIDVASLKEGADGVDGIGPPNE